MCITLVLLQSLVLFQASTCTQLFVKIGYPVSSFPALRHRHFSNLSIRSPSDVNSQNLDSYFQHHNRYTRYTYIGCSLLQEIQGTFSRLILIFFSLKASIRSRSFSVAGPTVWNSIPDNLKSSGSLRSFRHHLKTHLFYLTNPLQCPSGFIHP